MQDNDFFNLLAISMGRNAAIPKLDADGWQGLYDTAVKQTLVGVMQAGIDAIPRREGPPLGKYTLWAYTTEKIEDGNASKAEAARSLYGLFTSAGMRCCILKGASSARLYPMPKRRQSGDIDIWVEGGREQVLSYLKGVCKVGEIVYHHCDARLVKGVHVEVHFTPTWMNSPVLNRRLQRYFASCAEREFSSFDPDLGFACTSVQFTAVYSVVHAWRHVADEGVGLRQLMDIHYALEALPQEERAGVRDALSSFGLRRFTAAVMYVLGAVFGLEETKMVVLPDGRRGAFLLEEVLLSGNFGRFDVRNQAIRSSSSRTSKMLKKFCRALRFMGMCPRDVLASPMFKAWQYLWRRRHHYL